MKAISIQQPWAAMIALGLKDIETRTWGVEWREDLLIVSSKIPVFERPLCQCPHCFKIDWAEEFFLIDDDRNLRECHMCNRRFEAVEIDASQGGQAICVVTVVNCRPMTPEDQKRARCRSYDGAVAWELANLRKINPCPVRGHQSIYEVNLAACREANR